MAPSVLPCLPGHLQCRWRADKFHLGRPSSDAGRYPMLLAAFGSFESLEYLLAPAFREAVHLRCQTLGWSSPAVSGLR